MTMTEAERDALEKLTKLDEAGEFPSFTPEERKALKSLAKAMRGLEAIGWLAGSLKTFLIWLGIIVGAWVSWKAGFLEWLRANL
jgi:hypothetical protein